MRHLRDIHISNYYHLFDMLTGCRHEEISWDAYNPMVFAFRATVLQWKMDRLGASQSWGLHLSSRRRLPNHGKVDPKLHMWLILQSDHTKRIHGVSCQHSKVEWKSGCVIGSGVARKPSLHGLQTSSPERDIKSRPSGNRKGGNDNAFAFGSIFASIRVSSSPSAMEMVRRR